MSATTETTETIKPWHDAPPCPACKAPCGSLDGEGIPAGHLRCLSCGDDWEATAAELEQARASDAAWEIEQDRQDHEQAGAPS